MEDTVNVEMDLARTQQLSASSSVTSASDHSLASVHDNFDGSADMDHLQGQVTDEVEAMDMDTAQSELIAFMVSERIAGDVMRNAASETELGIEGLSRETIRVRELVTRGVRTHVRLHIAMTAELIQLKTQLADAFEKMRYSRDICSKLAKLLILTEHGCENPNF